MLIIVDPNNGIPVYRQIMDQVKLFVSSGVLLPGDPLPSTRNLSSQLGINPMTISKAYSFLEREDIVERRPGLPLVVKQSSQEESVRRKREQLKDALRQPVRIVRQLEIENDNAVEIFRAMLKDPEESE